MNALWTDFSGVLCGFVFFLGLVCGGHSTPRRVFNEGNLGCTVALEKRLLSDSSWLELFP
jgi:hypothetical protein